ncbi:SufD family Fe-S cluster assembly protein [Candidatus Woesearchaeota archaeon]|nr:SufD family Fe-S cluster assembly protein [Candidatus Woesearchaeota archaeon]
MQISLPMDGPDWFIQKRKECWNEFEKINLDLNLRYGLSLRFDLSGLDLSSVELKKSKIKVDTELFSFEKLDEYEDFFMNNFIPNQDKFTLYHSSLLNNLVIIHIKEDKEINIDIELKDKYHADHILIIVEKNVKANIIENIKGNCIFRTGVVEIYLKEKAKLNYFLLDEIKKGNNFTVYRGLINKDSELTIASSLFSNGINRMENSVVMNGENAKSEIYNLYFGNENSRYDIYNAIVHGNKNCFSNMLSKGAVKDKAQTIHRGLIEIKKGFTSNNGYQKEEALILNDGAKANAVPNLKIDNDDVRCTHGVTISHLDNEKLFYLMSRGLDKKEAIKNYLIGYFYSVLCKFPEKLREIIIERIHEKLK